MALQTFTMTMTTEKKMLAVILSILVLGCSPAKHQKSDAIDTAGLGTLPRITHGGIGYPYTRYSESSGQIASRGRAFFLYPIKTSKTEILALEYAPGMRISDLFGEELIGTGGKAYYEDGRIGFSFLPISLPVGVVSGHNWPMKYAKLEFRCQSRENPDVSRGKGLSISCASEKYTLSFLYDEQLGITEFQDFCDSSVCTYKLMDSQGLLSRAMTLSMGLPNI
jgi:hypothetical protein